jgi:hypothetical protein
MRSQQGTVLLRIRRTQAERRNSLSVSKAQTASFAAIVLLSFAALTGMAKTGRAQTQAEPGGKLRMDKVDDPTPINQPPDANTQMLLRERSVKRQNFSAANTERRRQIAEDTAKLTRLAADLKDEIEKAAGDTLSIAVIRKADEIEKLAHSVKEKMKLTVSAN